MKTTKTLAPQRASTAPMADEFLALLLELESLNADRVIAFSDEMRSRSHIPNKTS